MFNDIPIFSAFSGPDACNRLLNRIIENKNFINKRPSRGTYTDNDLELEKTA
jgi:hypothetical protein